MPVCWETFFGSYNLFTAEIFFSELQHLRQRGKGVNEHPLSDLPFLFYPRLCHSSLFYSIDMSAFTILIFSSSVFMFYGRI